MTPSVAPLLGVMDGARDAELRRLAIYGTNAELEAAIQALTRRAVLTLVPQDTQAPGERASG